MKLAFVFPGQGSQSLNMMSGYGDLPCIRKTFQQASDILDTDLWAMVEQGPVENLNLTINTQPIMLCAGVAVYRAWNELYGVQPDIVAGHSLGEYTALVAAGALTFEQALPLVRFRAEAMQTAVPEGVGAMAVILGLDSDAVKEICAEAANGEVLQAVNFNSPEQTVIAGHKAAIERGMELAKAKNAKRALLLPMSVPSHCVLMHDAASALKDYLRSVSVQKPKCLVIHNVDVQSHSDPEEIKQALVEQLYSPVRWVETIHKLAELEVNLACECAPGKVLAGLNKRIRPEMQMIALANGDALKQAGAAVETNSIINS